ncbi:hypothetical protein [Nesterenkonia pannonica]|uniref:5'-3' exonuclease H3TH domain-containing protein n=1 Tax=Nesterenkonia pannonica TaxID=1548602 RepID=UPI00216462D3|nr:5'-3' exonuclease H3TH domain-containing protein [Nesterenkonia pannonica]
MGESADNLPGVPKVGPKTAAKWIGQYGSTRGIIDHADEIKGKAREPAGRARRRRTEPGAESSGEGPRRAGDSGGLGAHSS